MRGISVFVRSDGGKPRWIVGASETAIAYCRTKRLALRVARALAMQAKCSVRIHGLNGRVLEERSYGNETRRPG